MIQVAAMEAAVELNATYDWSLEKFNEMSSVLASAVPQPIPDPRGEGRIVSRFRGQTAEQAIPQKLAQAWRPFTKLP